MYPGTGRSHDQSGHARFWDHGDLHRPAGGQEPHSPLET